MLKIGVDLDNVLAETGHFVAALVREHHNPNFNIRDWTKWHLTDCTELTHPQQEHLFSILHQQIRELNVVPDAVTALHSLNEHHIHIITHRPAGTEGDTNAWLLSNEIPHHRLTVCNDKTVYANQLDLLIDDSPEIAVKMADAGTPVLLFDQPWNRDLPRHPLITRVFGWRDTLALIQDQFLAPAVDIPDDPQPELPEGDILAEAYRLTSRDRQEKYGPPEEDFARTGKMWAALLDLKEPIEPHIVAAMMMCLKLSRIVVSPDQRDSWVDAIGYARCGWLCRGAAHGR